MSSISSVSVMYDSVIFIDNFMGCTNKTILFCNSGLMF